MTILGDDLYSRQPYCQALKDKHLHYILVCKRELHEYLYATLDYLSAQGVLGTKVVRKWNGKYGEIHTYRYADQLALRKEQPAIQVNWCEWAVRREETGEQLYRNAFITDFEVEETNVEAITLDGRTRWKVENENNNVLKTKDYHIEHNFGPGQQHLASFLLSLNLLAFLMHTILELVDEKYQAIRQALGRRRTFFQHLEALLCIDPDASRMQRRYQNHRQSLFIFLYRRDVSPTNNVSERALRPSVIHRKVIGCFRSKWGAHAYAALATVVDTAELNGIHAFAAIQSLFGRPSPPLPQWV